MHGVLVLIFVIDFNVYISAISMYKKEDYQSTLATIQ